MNILFSLLPISALKLPLYLGVGLGVGLLGFSVEAEARVNHEAKNCADQRLMALATAEAKICNIHISIAEIRKNQALQKAITGIEHLRSKSIRQLIKKNHINGLTVSRKYLQAIKQIYKKNGYRPLWIKNKNWSLAARQLRARLIQAHLDGLNSEDYPHLPASIMIFGASLSDLKLTYGILRFSEHLMAGRLHPNDVLKEHDLKPQHPKLQEVVSQLLKADRPNEVLDALAPPHEGYQRLKQKLVALFTAPEAPEDQDLVKAIIANMERWRWMPRDMGETFIWVNLPSYQVRLIDQDETVFKTRAIIGDVRWPTPLIASRIKNIIVNPSWVLPASVIKREILDVYENPTEYLAKENIHIFRRHGREVDPKTVDWKKVKNPRTYVFKQTPGRWNALGQVKILFPNQHSIYLHDTDDKNKFKHDVRAFSYGCIRIDRPMEFSNAVAAYDKHLTDQLPSSKLGDREIWLKYKAKMPVYLGYFTLEIDNGDGLIVYDDIYQYDVKISQKLGINSILN
jgi:murein L,D-transpeptidase YcbB/YkuD